MRFENPHVEEFQVSWLLATCNSGALLRLCLGILHCAHRISKTAPFLAFQIIQNTQATLPIIPPKVLHRACSDYSTRRASPHHCQTKLPWLACGQKNVRYSMDSSSALQTGHILYIGTYSSIIDAALLEAVVLPKKRNWNCSSFIWGGRLVDNTTWLIYTIREIFQVSICTFHALTRSCFYNMKFLLMCISIL